MLAVMRAAWRRSVRDTRTHQAGVSLRKYRPALDFRVLESRVLQSFITSNLHAAPQILPPTGLYTPVTVTGTFQEYHLVFHTVVVNNKPEQVPVIVDALLPGPKRSSFQVVDAYRQDQPKGKITLDLVDPAKGTFQFSFTIHLQATRRTTDLSGRSYNIIVGAGDTNGFSGGVLTVLVPHSV